MSSHPAADVGAKRRSDCLLTWVLDQTHPGSAASSLPRPWIPSSGGSCGEANTMPAAGGLVTSRQAAVQPGAWDVTCGEQTWRFGRHEQANVLVNVLVYVRCPLGHVAPGSSGLEDNARRTPARCSFGRPTEPHLGLGGSGARTASPATTPGSSMPSVNERSWIYDVLPAGTGVR